MIFDRSWYNRAGVEPVMGVLHAGADRPGSSTMVPAVEKAMVDSGIILIKYWLEVSADEQTRRLESRIDDPRKIWKLSPTDLKSYTRLVRLLPSPRHDVRGDRHGVGAVVRRPHRRQEARPPQHHLPPARPDPVRAAPPRDVKLPKAPSARRLRRAGSGGCATSPRSTEQLEMAAPPRSTRASTVARGSLASASSRTYQRAWLRSDLVAGVVLAAILVPQGMAYAELAGLPPVTGLYTTIACLVGYALDGSVAGAGARAGLVGVAADLRRDRRRSSSRATIRRRPSRSPG